MAENNYDLEYTGSMVDRILDTGYDLQNHGYIFRGLASHFTGTPTERTWLIAPTGSTGFGLSSPVPPGSIGICMYNGSSWSAEVLNTLTLDSAPTSGSGNGITSGAVKTLAESITNAIGQLKQSVSDRFTSLTLEDTTGSLQTELLSITLKYVFNGETESITSISILAATAEKAGLMSSADKQKLDSLIDNIRSIRLVDVTASADKGSQMDLSLKWTVNNTEEMLTYLTLLAATTNTAGLMSAADKAKLDRLNIVGCQYAGIATPSTTPLVVDAKMFYIAVQSGNYSNFGLTVPEGISILKNEGYGWAIENLVRIDDQPTDGSAGIARSGGTFSMISTESATRESADATLSEAVVAEQNARKAAIQEEKNAREHADDMMIHEIETFEQGVRDTVAEYKPIVIQGDVQNAPDEVDLTSTPDNLLKFKDNIYNPVLWSGMGRIYLRKNIIPESENYPFDGFVNDVPTGGELDGEPDAVLWDRINTVFVGEKDGVYYNTWTACDKYVPARTNVIYMYDGTPYLWDGDDFAVDEDVVPNLKNILTEDMMPYGNTIYVIRWDYYLNGDVTVPDSCILEFDGGSVNGAYTITGNNTQIKAQDVAIFKNGVIIAGSWICPRIVSTWFNDATSTNRLQQLINLSNDNVDNHIVITPGNYSVDDTYDSDYDGCLKVKSNTILEVNGIITLEPNPNTHYRVLLIYQKQNVTVFGKGSLVGDRDTHTGTAEVSQWGHVIAISDSKDIIVRGISVSYAWGDNVCIADGSERVYIQNCEIYNGGRQGITVGTASNVFIENCYIHDITRIAPFACIDIEPNAGGYSHTVTIQNCKFENPSKTGIQVGGTGNVVIDGILIDNNEIQNVSWGVKIAIGTTSARVSNNIISAGDVGVIYYSGKNIIENNIIESQDIAIYYGIGNAIIQGNQISGIITNTSNDINIQNTKILNNNINGNVYLRPYSESVLVSGNTIVADTMYLQVGLVTENTLVRTALNNSELILFKTIFRNNRYTLILNEVNNSFINTLDGKSFIEYNHFVLIDTEDDKWLYDAITGNNDSYNKISNNIFEFQGHGVKVKHFFSNEGKYYGENNEMRRDALMTIHYPYFIKTDRVGSTRPTLFQGEAGTEFFDTTLNKPIYWTGTNWVDATGATV